MFAFTALFTDTATRSVRLTSKQKINLRDYLHYYISKMFNQTSKSSGCLTIACHNIKHVLWHAVAARVALYSQLGLKLDSTFPSIQFLINGFFLIGIHSTQGWTATIRHGVTRKKAQKKLEDTENLFRMKLHLKDVC